MSAEATEKVLHPYWHGMLCAETRDDIAQRMRNVLDGRYFTLVVCNSYSEDTERFSSVEAYPSQWLMHPVRDYADKTLAGISWSTPRLSMGVHTAAATQTEARDGGPHKYVRFTFEHDQFVIDHFAPARYRLQWIFAVEHHDPEDPITSDAAS